ncbi:MAG: High molecular weight rubredoxin [Peptococcaceae bacterium]|nr:High molecular weight rubredoxin [Peptococcaceae bacterium]
MDNTALFQLSYGLYVVTTKGKGRINGQIANTVFQISDTPVRLGVGLNKNNLTNELVKDSGILSVQVLERDVPFDVISRFGFQSGRNVDKFADIAYQTNADGCPILVDGIAAQIDCKVIGAMDVGSHTLFICEMTDAIRNDKTPLTYAQYHERKKNGGALLGAAAAVPEVAPTAPADGTNGKRYQCMICGHIYDEAKEGVPFADLPEDWECPICHVKKKMFTEVK